MSTPRPNMDSLSTARLGDDSVVTLNEHAPVLASSEVVIAADPQIVWDVLTDFGRWPDWNADVRMMWLQGDGQAGTTFRWKTRSNTINSRIEHVDSPSRILWTGKSSGIRATHLHELEARNGGTFVRTEESFEGLVARILRRRLNKVVQAALDSELRQLRIEAERRSTRAAPDVTEGD
ncbi:MAG TPA: SRPBCC family protein [Actinomycetes bacterium]|nr:SRPBCC family protein [Actinomycetes bacterium]